MEHTVAFYANASNALRLFLQMYKEPDCYVETEAELGLWNRFSPEFTSDKEEQNDEKGQRHFVLRTAMEECRGR